MTELIVYGTVACHLCEQAEEIIERVALVKNLTLIKRDIVENKDWLERYRLHIPVAVFEGKELFWPFDKQQFEDFLKTIS